MDKDWTKIASVAALGIACIAGVITGHLEVTGVTAIAIAVINIF